MESSRAKLVGPAIAVGAISAGLVLIGACGVGQHDTYVSPPPLKSGPYVAPAANAKDTSSTAPKVIIPPSPSWQVAQGPPRRPPGFTVPPSTSPGSTPRSDTDEPTTRRRPTPTTDETAPTTRPPTTPATLYGEDE
ncbi:hypothetical protein [Nocardia sp. NPDC052566]|uniref:hypothetical protein n=1 Tax=Nocardia sp. NPDC052566 TaxID=3364330 RepID=UPI0037CB0704